MRAGEHTWEGYRDRQQISHLLQLLGTNPSALRDIGRALAPRDGPGWTRREALRQIESGTNAAYGLQELLLAAVGGQTEARRILGLGEGQEFRIDGRIGSLTQRLIEHVRGSGAMAALQDRLDDASLYHGRVDGIAGERTIQALAQATSSPAEIQRVFGISTPSPTAVVPVEPVPPTVRRVRVTHLNGAGEEVRAPVDRVVEPVSSVSPGLSGLGVASLLPRVPRTLLRVGPDGQLLGPLVPVVHATPIPRQPVIASIIPDPVVAGSSDDSPQPREIRLARLEPGSGHSVSRIPPSRPPLRAGPGGQLLGQVADRPTLHLRFGQRTIHETLSHGMGLQIRPGATIYSPVDGQVVYSGEFLTYGRIVIISTGEGANQRHVVLSGLAASELQEGQHVLRGEPIGAMAARGPGVVDGGGVLTLEVRETSTNRFIDPASLLNDDFRRLLGLTPSTTVASVNP
jgi:hypothetical protein